jgi:uncharacterized protein (TIGR02996 family)
MRENAAFLQAILAEPDDDAPRLIYADWLEERGDVRGEFIRVQCALARMASDDPRRAELELRERELLAGHRQAWLGVLPSWEGITRVEFGRGFIASIQTTFDAFRTHADELFRLVPVDSICFDDFTVTDAPALAHSPHLAQLTEVSFDSRDLAASPIPIGDAALAASDAIATALAASPYLTRLTALGFNHIGDVGLTALAGSPNLRRLSSLRLGEPKFGHRGGGGFSPEGIATLLASPHLTRLVKLTFRNPRFEPPGVRERFTAALAAAPRLPALKELRLFWTGMYAEGAVALATSPLLAGLTSLDLHWNNIDAEGAEALTRSPCLSQLTRLDLADNRLGERGALVLADLPQRSQLAHLNLWENRIGGRGAAALVAAPYLRRLKSLRLGLNQIGDAGAAALAASFDLPALTWLDLYDNGIGDAGAEALAASPHLTHLTCLELANINAPPAANHIGDAGAIALAASPYLAGLTRLNLDGNPIGSRGQQALLGRFGDPLGQLVRVESELARLAPHDPRRAGLEGREVRLLAEGALPEGTELTLVRESARAAAEGVVTHAWVFLDRAEALFQAVPSLQHARLQVSWVADRVTRLAASPYLARLTTLDLSGNGYAINDEGAQELAASPYLVNLTALDLSGNRISDVGAEALAASPYLARLTTLDLGNNPISDRGERALRSRFGDGVVRL